MRGQPIKSNRITNQQARTAMMLFLYECRDEALARATSEQLQRQYRVDAQTATYELTIARQKRGVQAA